jgi:hypothetical protein
VQGAFRFNHHMTVCSIVRSAIEIGLDCLIGAVAKGATRADTARSQRRIFGIGGSFGRMCRISDHGQHDRISAVIQCLLDQHAFGRCDPYKDGHP